SGCLQGNKPDLEHLRMLSEANAGCGIIIALLLLYEIKFSLRPKSRLTLCNNLCRNARVGYSGQGGTPSSSSVWCCSCPGQRRNSDVAGCRPWRAPNGSGFSAETLTDDQRV